MDDYDDDHDVDMTSWLGWLAFVVLVFKNEKKKTKIVTHMKCYACLNA